MEVFDPAPRMVRERPARWVHLFLAVILAFGLGAVDAQGAPGGKRPILTKSGQKAAIQAAAAAIAPAMATSPTDGTKIPHYFGPFPNWANSPFTVPNAVVTIGGDGAGATAAATVGANGAVTGITVTNPGTGYTAATVAITGSGAGATADAVVSLTGVVSTVTLDAAGAGYTAPVVTISGGGATTDATATAYGGVDAVVLLTPAATPYTFPTVDFDLPNDPNGVQAQAHVDIDPVTGNWLGIILDNPGSGYSSAPNVVIRDGTLFDPVRNNPGTGATATCTLALQSIVLNTFGAGYTSAPTALVSDAIGTGTGALATAAVSSGGVTAITLTAPGTGYFTGGGIRKFVDTLPGLTPAGANNLGQYLPVAVPDTTTFAGADYYVIAVVQQREKMHSDLPPTLMRKYVQLSTSVVPGAQVPLQTDLLNGTSVATLMPDGTTQAVAVDNPHFLGPVIVAQKGRPVRIVFYNLLPSGSDGDLFLPTDSTIMGSGPHPDAPDSLRNPLDEGTVMDAVRNPACTEYPKSADCFKDDRATLHLHGGTTPWISDGTPHQWITPATEATPWPQGVSVAEVPDMTPVAGVPDCTAKTDGCQTFYYTNQQSARLLFYHDHAWGITRLNVYAGEAAGYLITDPTDQRLVTSGVVPADQIPLVIQDRTFVPPGDPATRTGQLYEQDPTWDETRWGGYGNFWYHHVYMPAQNPGDPGGMSAYGRWMYGPWFWPPATPAHGPIANPYYDPNCNLNDPATWQYQTDPFCEPQQIPGTPNISVGMEQFNDTPIVNGTAYPTLTVDPKSYRFRILSAANDRFFNLQWYIADPTTASTALNGVGLPIGGTEVALKAAELAAAQLDPVVFPTPDTAISLPGPDWIQIGTEGGFLPAPVVVNGHQNTTWITDPTRFDVGNVDLHSLLLAPAERADVIVDFSRFAGQTLILYNDAPAAFPARVPSYDYYTGAPDQSPIGAPAILPGYGPNTRTIMQVKVNAVAPAPTFNLAALQAAFRHKADGSGVFESGQHPIIVGQAPYNSAYGTNFVAAGWCNAPGATGPALTRCDGYARIAEGNKPTDLFGFNSLRGAFAPGVGKLQIPFQPKGIHDEMNSTAFDEFGRMQANIGLEAPNANPLLQNITLYPYVNPPTELFDGTSLPQNGDISVTPIASAGDGSQVWKITHNGVDTHPIHWHLYDVQLLNRVTWDNIIIPPDATELGWKDTLRISPLEDTIVAVRPVIPLLPFELPNSIRPLHPAMPIGSMMGFNNVDALGNPTAPIVNDYINFGQEYVWHCHILSHEEMDMMRPVSVSMPPVAPDGLAWTSAGNGNNATLTLTWNDNSVTETAFQIQRNDGSGWIVVGTDPSPLTQPNTKGVRSYVDTTFRNNKTTFNYRVVAQNTVGYGQEFMSLTTQSMSGAVVVIQAPTGLTATLEAGPQVRLSFTDNAGNETGFAIERSTDGVTFTQIGTAPARNNVGGVTYIDAAVAAGTTYTYRVAAQNAAGFSAYSNTASVALPAAPVAPGNFAAANGPNGNGNSRTVILTWIDSDIETGYTIQRATDATFTAGLNTATVGANIVTLTQTGLNRNTSYYYRIQANNGAFIASAWVNATPFPILTNP